MIAGEPQPLLHNMSAPPRAQIGFRAVQPGEGPTEQSEAAACGLRWLARFDLCDLLGSALDQRVRRRAGGASAPPPGERRLRLALARARAEASGSPLSKRIPRRIAVLPIEMVADALRDVAAELPLAGMALPAFGLLLPARGPRRGCTQGVRLTVAVLARRRGTVFLRDAKPLAPAALDEPALDLWVPLPAGGEGPCRDS